MSEFSYFSTDLTVKKDWRGCSYPHYDPEIHIPMLQRIYRQGGAIMAFCAECQISQKTFWKWIEDHKEFNQQYDISICEGGQQWEMLLLDAAKNGITINTRYWEMVGRARYKYSQVHLEKEKEDTTASRMAAAWISMQQGGITPQEYNQIASGLSTESKILEVDLQREIVDQLKEQTAASKQMTDEALRAFMLVKSGKGKVVENE